MLLNITRPCWAKGCPCNYESATRWTHAFFLWFAKAESCIPIECLVKSLRLFSVKLRGHIFSELWPLSVTYSTSFIMVPVQTCSKMDKAAFLGNNWTKLTAINDQKTCAIRLAMCVQLVLRKGSDLIWSHTTTPVMIKVMMIVMLLICDKYY